MRIAVSCLAVAFAAVLNSAMAKHAESETLTPFRVHGSQHATGSATPSRAGGQAVRQINYSDLASAVTLGKGKTFGTANIANIAAPNLKRRLQPHERVVLQQLNLQPRTAGNVRIERAPLRPLTSVSPPPVSGFSSLSTMDNLAVLGGELEPPDQGLAVNNNVIVVATNLAIQFYDANSFNPLLAFSGVYATPLPLPYFFGDPNVFSDPQVFFDPTLYTPSDTTAAAKGRWIVTAMSSEGFVSGSPTGSQYIDVAVSVTSDPRGVWNVYRIETFSSDLPGCGSADCLPDYPKMGFDSNGFFISVDLFNNVSTGAFVGAATYALPKAPLRDNAGFLNYWRFIYNDGDSFLVQPSMPAPGQPSSSAMGGTEFLLEARKATDSVSNTIRVWAIEHTSLLNSPSGVTVTGVDVATPSTPGMSGYYSGYTLAMAQPDPLNGSPLNNSYLLDAPYIDGGYGGFQATIQYAAGRLYGILTTANAYNSANLLSWYGIAPTVNSKTGVLTASLKYKGTITPPAGYSISYGAFGLIKKGAGVIGFNVMNPAPYALGNFPSTGYVKFTGSNLSGNLIITGVGVAPDDGFTSLYDCCYATNGVNGFAGIGRWGDYSAAVVDPAFAAAKSPVYYTGGEMIAVPYTKFGASANWTSYISQIH